LLAADNARQRTHHAIAGAFGGIFKEGRMRRFCLALSSILLLACSAPDMFAGTFQKPMEFLTGNAPWAMAVGDFQQ
jgi:hypothetical protein